MLNHPLAVFATCTLLTATTARAAAPLRVDLGMNTGRSDTAAPGWIEWQVPDGAEASREFDGVRVTLRAAGKGGLRGVWNKKLLLTAPMAADGIVAAYNGIDIVLNGLTPGTHSIATYHNNISSPVSTGLELYIVGNRPQVVGAASRQATNDDDVFSAYLEFVATADKPVVIRMRSGSVADVILNGFEIDHADPLRKAKKPRPANFDWHVDADSGEIELSWDPAAEAVNHKVYVGADADPNRAEINMVERGETPGAFNIKRAALALPVNPNASLLHYRWRVDSIDRAGNVTKGDVWSFRPRHLAFPGAEGYGRFAIGGRGGRVVKVTNLNDSGPGSLRAAVELDEPRTVVFDVSGKIVLQSTLGIRNPYLTVAGQTAPGKGICIANYNMGAMGTHDLIIRYMRVRPGNTSGDTLDGMGMASTTDAIYDHCSISWTQDESFSSRGAGNITLQRTLISEALNIAGHRKYEKGKQHGYAASIGGDIGSFHHNLLAHCSGRNWSLAGGLNQATRHAGRLDIRNNVVYNWGHRTTDGGAKEVQFVNNYYKPGPASDVFHVLMAEREAVAAFGPQMYHVAGNMMEGKFGPDEPLAGVFERRGEPHKNWIVAEPFYESHVTTQSAEDAYENVLSDVGCNVPYLDDHDERVIDEVRTGTTTYKGSVSGLPGLPDTQDDVGGWDNYPELHRDDNYDPDNDGMPSAWEKANGLNPAEPVDAGGDENNDGYTNLEEFLNALSKSPSLEGRG